MEKGRKAARTKRRSQCSDHRFLLSFAAGAVLVTVGLVLAYKESNLSWGPRWRHQDSPFRANVSAIVKYLTVGKGAGLGWNWLANITDTFGHRKIGSAALEAAINYSQKGLKAQGFDDVHTEAVPKLPNWTRGDEEAWLVSPRLHSMRILGVGGTPGTVAKGIEADAIVVESFKQLSNLGERVVKGKIVVYNQPWVDYGTSVAYRNGAPQAAKLGAVAVLIRSVTSFSVYSPHTGQGAAPIPAACLTVEDAEMLWRMQERGQRLRIKLRITSGSSNHSITSRNQIFQLKGREKPNEIVLLSGHFDSWDVGTGAMDDGGGCAVMWTALTALKALGLRPKRTIRVVLWTAEEPGHLGAAYYHSQHPARNGNESFFFVSESDGGVFRPTSKNATMQANVRNATLLSAIRATASLLNKAGIPLSVTNGSFDLGDAQPWATEGVPGFVYLNQDTYNHYFIFHHTQADTMTVLAKEDIDYTGAVFASFAWVLANL